jgi:hypothetical protein
MANSDILRVSAGCRLLASEGAGRVGPGGKNSFRLAKGKETTCESGAC